MTNTDHAAIESLRTFAAAHNELAFAHLCTAALQGEEWAIERITDSKEALAAYGRTGQLDHDDTMLLIANTDTTRPDGATPRTFNP